MMRYILSILISIILAGNLMAQHQKVLHQSFQLDSLQEVNLDLFDNYKIEPWAGDAILVETTVKLYDASTGILEFLIENGRYEIEADTNMATFGLSLISKDKERKVVKTKKGQCFEEVEVRVFLPDDFEKTEQHTWAAVEQSAPTNDTPPPLRSKIKAEPTLADSTQTKLEPATIDSTQIKKE